MPHSSGGGSHGGGSHSSSGGHGGSSGSSGRTSNHYFNGARTFVFYKDKKPVYKYANYNIIEEGKMAKSKPITFLFIMLFFTLFFYQFFIISVETFHKLNSTSEYVSDIEVVDKIDILSSDEENKILEQLKAMYDKTGVPIVFLTDSNENWKPYYSSLENYAYDKYCQHFRDEYHWLIVYTQPEDLDPNFVDWYWEGMIGDYIEPAIHQTKIDSFNKIVQEELYRNVDNPGKAFILGFENLYENVDKISVNWSCLFMILLVYSLLLFGMINSCFIEPKKVKKYANYIEVKTDKPIEIKCDYCGGVYILGTCLSCPHCAAPVKTIDEYYTEKNYIKND